MSVSRREFLKTTTLTAIALNFPAGNILGANDTIRVAIIGIGNKGKQHVDVFHQLPKVKVTALCDVDPERLEIAKQEFDKRNESVFTCTDARQIMDRKDVDAVVIATSNHWHALQTIWACQAGKDVYIEKPLSHTIWEGQKMVEAARKYNRIVQIGTQNRSDAGIREAIEYVHQGHLGQIQWMRCVNYELRPSLGNRKPWYPAWFDYDYWCGPSELTPLMRDEFHYNWHWIWHSGNGDLANNAVHDIDLCRMYGKIDRLPSKVISLGERFIVNDAGQTPNTMITMFEYENAPPIITEIRHLPKRKGLRAVDSYRGIRFGHIIQCDSGYFAGGRGGGWVYDNAGKKVKQFSGDGGRSHQANFIEAMRKRDKTILKADVKEGHISTSTAHFGNISYLLGRNKQVDKLISSFESKNQMVNSIKSLYKHLKANEIDIASAKAKLGSWLSIDSNKTEIVAINNERNKELVQKANAMRTRKYRKPFVIPDQV